MNTTQELDEGRLEKGQKGRRNLAAACSLRAS